MGHLEILGYLFAILVVVYLVYRNSDKKKENNN